VCVVCGRVFLCAFFLSALVCSRACMRLIAVVADALHRVGASWAFGGAIIGWIVWMKQPNAPSMMTRTAAGTVRARALVPAEYETLEKQLANPPDNGPRFISRNERQQLQAYRRAMAAVERRKAREEAVAAHQEQG